MKSKFGRMAGIVLVVGACGAVAAPAPVYENRSDVNMPMVDATTFLNRGAFHVSTLLSPYLTQNTLNYTNFAGATIDGSGGFYFENAQEDGSDDWASSFANFGTISFDSTFGGFFTGGFSTAGLNSTWLRVDATNILNRGGLAVSSDGLIHLRGSQVDVSRSGLRAGEDPFTPITPGQVTGAVYSNERGITDLYWGVGQNNSLDPNAAGPYDLASLTGNPPASGLHEVLDRTTLTNLVSLSATNVYARTNALSATNWVVQAVFVNTNTPDPNFKIEVKFGAARRPNVPGATMPIIRFSFEDVDTITTEPYTNFVYLLDNHGAMTNSILLTNRATRVDQRPSNFILTRNTPAEWARGQNTNVAYKADLLYNANYAGQTVTNWYSGYSAQIGSLPGTTINGGSLSSAGGGGVLGVTQSPTHPTNLPGRIEIEADRLDLSLARFRSEGLLSIKAKELVGTAPYKLDSPVVSINAGLSSAPLVVSNLVQPEVRRFFGTISAYSAIWTNQTTATAPDPATPGSLITNTVDIRFHVLIVEHNFITRVPVDTYRFNAQSSGFQLIDDLNVIEGFSVDSPTVDLQGNVFLGTNSVTAETFPNTVSLTNRSSLYTSRDVSLSNGAGGAIGTINNQGSIVGNVVDVTAGDYLQSGSINSTVGDLTLNAGKVQLEGGLSASSANLFVHARELSAKGAVLNAGYEQKNFNSGNTNYFPGSLTLDVSDKIGDGGTEVTNFWTVYDGFRMPRRAVAGDLLGTVITSKANRFVDVLHTWAGADLGAVAAGFKDNSALGTLILDGRVFSLYTFRSPSTNSAAIYVDYLQLLNYATNIESALNIEPGFTIYFADSNLPADQLDGALGGRLKWVKDFAGAKSSASVALANGKTAVVNRALLRSTVLDSDGDGVVNALDASPFEPAALKVNVRVVGQSPAKAEVSWLGRPGASYRVEYSSRLDGTGWEVLDTVVNPDNSSGAARVLDSVASPAEQRFYRVVEVR